MNTPLFSSYQSGPFRRDVSVPPVKGWTSGLSHDYAVPRGPTLYPLDCPIVETPDWLKVHVLDASQVQGADRLKGSPFHAAPTWPARYAIWPSAKSAWLYEALSALFASLNDMHWHMALTGFMEPIAILEYGCGQGMDWHTDYSSWERVKLAMSVALNEPSTWTGGRWEGLDLDAPYRGGQPDTVEIGQGLIYPGWLAHRVTPVASGRRRVLVAFVSGPAMH
jgi:hypothetical protein